MKYQDSNSTDSYNVALGNNAFGHSTMTHLHRCIGIGYNCKASSSSGDRQIVMGYNADGWQDGGQIFEIDSTYTRVDIGSTTWASSSDERIKENIQDSTAGLSFINDLRPRTFNFKMKKDLPTTFKGYEEGSTVRTKGGDETTNHGFIAQEVKTALDNHSEVKDGSKIWSDAGPAVHGGIQNVAPTALIPMLVKAVQELSTELTAAKARITTLEG